MKPKQSGSKIKRVPGLRWRKKDLHAVLKAQKTSTHLSEGYIIGMKALEKHVQVLFRDFGAGQIESGKEE